jgi:phage shock protein PspC (stress-responsive transcriptional regulator)
MNLLLVIIGGFSLFVGFLGVFAIMRNSSEEEEYIPKRWLVGVCADVARILRVHVALVRLLVIIYAPFVIGLLFYIVYAILLKRRRQREAEAAAQQPKRPPATITKIDSIHYN